MWYKVEGITRGSNNLITNDGDTRFKIANVVTALEFRTIEETVTKAVLAKKETIMNSNSKIVGAALTIVDTDQALHTVWQYNSRHGALNPLRIINGQKKSFPIAKNNVP